MRCYICDTDLTDQEVQFSEDPKHLLEPCRKCDEIALDAAYSDGFSPGDDPTGLVEQDDFQEPELPFDDNELYEEL